MLKGQSDSEYFLQDTSCENNGFGKFSYDLQTHPPQEKKLSVTSLMCPINNALKCFHSDKNCV